MGRKPLTMTALAALVALLAGPAAADVTRGTIAAVNDAQDMIQLEYGGWFHLGTGLQPQKLAVGDRVRIEHYSDEKGYPVAREITFLSNGKTMTGRGDNLGEVERSLAFAGRMLRAQEFRGRIASIDRAGQYMTLSDGQVFKIGTDVDSKKLDTGDHVLIRSWGWNDAGYRVAGEVKTLQATKAVAEMPEGAGPSYYRHTIVGKIQSVDHADNTVTLDDGTILKLGTGLHSSGLRPGDKVRAHWSEWARGFRQANELKVLS